MEEHIEKGVEDLEEHTMMEVVVEDLEEYTLKEVVVEDLEDHRWNLLLN